MRLHTQGVSSLELHQGVTLSLRDYLGLIRAGRWLMAVGLLGGMAVGLLVTVTTAPTFVATSTLYVTVEGGLPPDQAYQGALLSEQKAGAYVQLLGSERVRQDVAAAVGFDVAPGSITGEALGNSSVLVATITDTSARRAQQAADAVGVVFTDLVAELEEPNVRNVLPTVLVRVVQQAELPTAPVGPRGSLNVGVGGLVGLALGFAVAVVRRVLDTSITSADMLRDAVGAPVLGVVTSAMHPRGRWTGAAWYAALIGRRRAGSPVALLPAQTSGVRAESIRRLRTALCAPWSTPGCRAVLVTSPSAGEDRTSTAFDLAVVLGLDGRRVLLMDADLRSGRATSDLGHAGEPGLTTALLDRSPLAAFVQSLPDVGDIDFLPAGPLTDRPSELLSSGLTNDALAELRVLYDVLVIDAPPLLTVTDATLMAPSCDGVLLVVRQGRTTAEQVRRASAELDLVAGRLLGTVLCTGRVRRRDPAGPTGAAGNAGEPVENTTKPAADGDGDGPGAEVERPAPPSGSDPTAPPSDRQEFVVATARQSET